jgi:glycosyltransferase involved in cell wall biosynthesis
MFRIFHLTEALGGGVLHCIALLANEQVCAGHDVTLAYSIRGETPEELVLAQLFDSRIKRIVVELATEIGLRDLKSMLLVLWLLQDGKYDAIHFHSSKAGALGRVAAFCNFQISKTCYSPHGFSFLRRDISDRKRKLFWWFERSLHAIGGKIAACSQSEKKYAEQYLQSRRSHLLENAIDVGKMPAKDYDKQGNRARVVISGRVTYAKAPWRVARIARVVSGEDAEFVWLGDGEAALKAEWIGDSPIRISGWLGQPRLLDELTHADVFLFTSLWEGMPIALIEAQTIGLPAVATNVIGNKDIVVHGETGFLANSEDELLFYTNRLVQDRDLRKRLGTAARENAFRRFGKDRFLQRSLSIYFGK